MNALRVFWKYTTVKDKFAITFFAFFMPALIVFHAVEKQSRGALAKGFWAIGALVFFFYCMGIFALIFGLYRQAKKAENTADLNRRG